MTYNRHKLRYQRDGNGYLLLYDGHAIARLEKVRTLRRAWSKSNMGTWHRDVWQASLDGIDDLEPPERMRVRKPLRERARGTRAEAARYVLDCYERAAVPLPADPARASRAA